MAGSNNGLLAPALAAGIAREEREVDQRQVRQAAVPEASAGASNARDITTVKAQCARAIIAVLLACGLRPVRSGGAYDEPHTAALRPMGDLRTSHHN